MTRFHCLSGQWLSLYQPENADSQRLYHRQGLKRSTSHYCLD